MQAVHEHPRQGAFSLVELLVGLALSALLLTVVLGLAMYGSYQRAENTRTMLSAAQVERGLFIELVRRVRFAVTIDSLSPTAITFTMSDPADGPNPQTYAYRWDESTSELYHTAPGQAETLAARDVREFRIGADLRSEDGQARAVRLKLAFQLGSESAARAEEIIDLPNLPNVSALAGTW